MKFIGIDLAWKVNNQKENTTAICIIDNSCNLLSYKSLTTDEQIIEFIKSNKNNEPLAAAIDAPLIVNNEKGIRECDRLLLKLGIPCLPVNKTIFNKLYGGVRGEILVHKLKKLGFKLAYNLYEVYPYATLKNLFFQNSNVPKYKKSKKEFNKLLNRFSQFAICNLEFTICNLTPHLIDAILSAYTIYIYFKNKNSCLLLGDKKNGFILIPQNCNFAMQQLVRQKQEVKSKNVYSSKI